MLLKSTLFAAAFAVVTTVAMVTSNAGDKAPCSCCGLSCTCETCACDAEGCDCPNGNACVCDENCESEYCVKCEDSEIDSAASCCHSDA